MYSLCPRTFQIWLHVMYLIIFKHRRSFKRCRHVWHTNCVPSMMVHWEAFYLFARKQWREGNFHICSKILPGTQELHASPIPPSVFEKLQLQKHLKECCSSSRYRCHCHVQKWGFRNESVEQDSCSHQTMSTSGIDCTDSPISAMWNFHTLNHHCSLW